MSGFKMGWTKQIEGFDCGLRRIIRLLREHKFAEKAAMLSHEPVAQLGEPDQRGPGEGPHQPTRVANDLQDEQPGPPGLDDAPVGRNDVNGPLAGFIQRRRHRRRGARLVGDGIKFLLGILAPDPGDCSPSEASVAIPDEPMLVRLNGLGGVWLFQDNVILASGSVHHLQGFKNLVGVVTAVSTISSLSRRSINGLPR